MKLTKRQKSGFAVLAIALLALVADRVLTGGGAGPAEASASSNEAPAEPAAEAAVSVGSAGSTNPAGSAAPNSGPSTLGLARRLETLWSERDPNVSQDRDVFSLSQSWLFDVDPSSATDRPVDGQTERDAATVFEANHQLRGSIRGSCITVDDHVLKLGDELDGFMLIAIDDDCAIFEADGAQVTLRMLSDR